MEYKTKKGRFLRHLLSAPFIYILIIPFILLDIFVELYHHICFPLYNLPLIQRSKYIKLDRHKLSYLSPLEKINCTYCGYANCLLHYISAIAASTEKYWCGIKSAQDPNFIPPKHHHNFIEHNDEQEFKKKYQLKK